MQVLLLLLPLVLPVVMILIVRHATPPIKALLKSGSGGRPRKPIIIRDVAAAQQLLVRGSRMPSMTPSAVMTGGRYNNITSAPSGQLWRALRHNLTSGVLHPTNLNRYAATRRQALRGLVADLREQQLTNGMALAAESIHGAMFGLACTMCFGNDGLDAGVVRAMADVQNKIILSIRWMRNFAPGLLTFLGVSRLIYRKRWNELVVIRQEQEDLYLPLIDGCRKHRRDSDETPSTYVDTLLDLHIPVESGADDHNQSQNRKLEDGELVGLCSEFLGQVTESTAGTLQCTLAHLIKDPDMQEAIREEIDAAVDADAEEVGEEVLGKLDLLNAVILEVFRLHPSVMWVFRQVTEEDQVVHNGRRIPTGTDVFFSIQAMGWDKAVWADPDDFKPERFHGCVRGESTTKNLLSMAAELKMMPFGVGRRMCPAISVSMLHITYFLANLVRDFVWEELEGEHAVQFQTDTTVMVFNRMQHPLRAHIVPRRPAAKKIYL
ncbi:unnamed protein product [Urochloa humidicola]